MPLINATNSVYRTAISSGTTVTWTRSGTTAAVMFISRPDSSEIAYRLSKGRQTPTPAVQPGTISFDPEHYPDLASARAWFPSMNELWDAVKAELWQELISGNAYSLQQVNHPCGGGGRNGYLP